MTKPRFNVGDRVIDRTVDDADPMVVIDPDVGIANEVFIEPLNASVAEVNPEAPAYDRVVSCVPIPWLERHVGDRWTNWSRASFPDRLTEFLAEWRIPVRSYDYPESRLDPAEKDPTPVTPGPSRDSHTQTRMAQWTDSGGDA